MLTIPSFTVLSIGVPMILMGDEVRRTQHGNNNPYCLDNEANWFDWALLEKHADVQRFVTLLNARRVVINVRRNVLLARSISPMAETSALKRDIGFSNRRRIPGGGPSASCVVKGRAGSPRNPCHR